MNHTIKALTATFFMAFAIAACSDDTPPPTPDRSGSQTGTSAQQERDALVFDTVRIDADGTGVVAGRSPARATVMVHDRGEEIISGPANSRGEWTLVIETPLAEGNAELTLKARLTDGTMIDSRQNISVLVSERGEAPVVVATSNDDSASRVLQQGEGASEGGELLLETIDYTQSGHVILSGRSETPRTIRAYLNNDLVGDGAVNEDGHWTITGRDYIAPGNYQLRLDQLDETGAVRARVSLPFTRLSEEFAGSVTIKRGDNLWTIARNVYGSGFKYTVIYEANKGDIRDPDLIYPNQIFTLPETSGGR